jgi:hypothetical protein
MKTLSANKESNTYSKKVTMANPPINKANAQRKVAKSWTHVASGKNHKRNTANESGIKIAQKIDKEFFEKYFLTLKERHKEKSNRVKKRMLRRIIEKRKAQSTHKCIGRTSDRLGAYLSHKMVSTCMKEIYKYQQCS